MEPFKGRMYTIFANVCRWVLALVLAVSGFVKAVDPVGSMYKLREYAEAFSLEGFSDEWLLLGAVVQAALEFLLGVFMFMGVYRRFVASVVPLMMLFFTALTLVIYLDGSVEDCGCFGEAVTLTNGETFAKNLFLLFLSLVVFLGRRRFAFNVSSKCRWMVTIFAIFYIALVEIMSLSHLPVIDFGTYRVGADLRALAIGTPGEYGIVDIYECAGDTIELPEGEEPDTLWTFVGSGSRLIKEGVQPVIDEFSLLDWENDYDAASEILEDSGYVCIVAIESVEKASVSRVDKINDMYDYCMEQGVPFYVTTSSNDDGIALWRKRTGAEYPLYWTAEPVLQMMIRANPGMMLLKDGVIAGKWNVKDLPPVEALAVAPTLMPDSMTGIVDEMRGWGFWMLLLGAPLLLIVLLDIVASRGTAAGNGDAKMKTENKDNNI